MRVPYNLSNSPPKRSVSQVQSRSCSCHFLPPRRWRPFLNCALNIYINCPLFVLLCLLHQSSITYASYSLRIMLIVVIIVYVDPTPACHGTPSDHALLLAEVLRVLHLSESSLHGSAVSIFVLKKDFLKSILVPATSHCSSVLTFLYSMLQHRLTQDVLITCASVSSLYQDFSDLSLDHRGMQITKSVCTKVSCRRTPSPCVLINLLNCCT